MPSLYSLNSRSHPFWDFVASLDDGASRNQASDQAENQQPSTREAGEPSKERPSARQPTVEDEVAAESSSREKAKAPEAAAEGSTEARPTFRGRGQCGRNESAQYGHNANRSGLCHGRRGGRGGFGEAHSHQHPPGEGFDGFGDFSQFSMRGPPFGGLGLFGPPHRGPPAHGPPGPHPHQHPHHRRGTRGGPDTFNLGEFLSNLGSRLGLDLSGAVEGLGLERLAGGNTSAAEGVDFEPRADLFDTPTSYLIHLSLPGAKKEDLGVDWDGENSVLRIAGVVHRPGVDETTLKLLAVDGRKREVGVFEKKIHLGTKRDPAKIDITGITAKMTDGILIVKVPKVEVEHKKRDVPISGSSPSPDRKEKHTQSYQSGTPHVDHDPALAPAAEKSLETATVALTPEMNIDDTRSETEKGDVMQYEDPAEELPEYKEATQGDAPDSEEDEGDYVKIDVK